MDKRILITGASGLVGLKLVKQSLQKGFKVSILSRKPENIKGVDVFLWDIEKQTIDKNCLKDVQTIIHLAGASIGEKKWTEARKSEIINSRIGSLKILLELLEKTEHSVKHFISASAVGYYGDQGDQVLTEDDSPGNDFLSKCCILWEEAAKNIQKLGINTSILRFGVVLDRNKGSLPVISKPIKFGFGAPLGTGSQWIPWIHHADLTAMLLFFINNSQYTGIYNAAAPAPVTNKQLTYLLAKNIGKFVWPIKIPKFLLKLILGEMSAIILNSNNTTSEKVIKLGFQFKYPTLKNALKEIYA